MYKESLNSMTFRNDVLDHYEVVSNNRINDINSIFKKLFKQI